MTWIRDARVQPVQPDLDPSLPGGELDGVREEVPEDLLEPVGIPHDDGGARLEMARDLDPLASAAGRTVVEGRQQHRRPRSTARVSSRSFPAMIRERSSRSSMSWTWSLGIPLDALERPSSVASAAPIGGPEPSRGRRRAASAARGTGWRGTHPWRGWRPPRPAAAGSRSSSAWACSVTSMHEPM